MLETYWTADTANREHACLLLLFKLGCKYIKQNIMWQMYCVCTSCDFETLVRVGDENLSVFVSLSRVSINEWHDL